MKKTLIAASILLPVIAYGLWSVMNARTYQVFGEIVPRVGGQSPVVALTFDDGPTPEYTDEVLAVLRERNVKATFFVTGRETDQNPAQAARIVADGHELGNHSYTHSRLVFKTPATVRTEIERTDAAIRNAGYEGEILFRPPYGKKLLVLPWVLDQTGRRTITCDVEPESYEDIAYVREPRAASSRGKRCRRSSTGC